MLARLHILLPFALTVPAKEEYRIYEHQVDGYSVKIYPPGRSEKADSYTDAEEITINDKPAFNADVFRVDFHKEVFNRDESTDLDPPAELIECIVNDFLSRLRYVANASKVSPIKLPGVNWHLRYLNDDGTELQKEEGRVRGKGSRKFQYSYVALNNEVWDNIHSISPDFQLPVWKMLLLDAESILPEVGPSIVLTFTALEIFISKTLDKIAEASELDKDLWNWINNRGFYLKEPSIDEKYDFLSKNLIGISIKSNSALWEPFKQLQKSRNTFVHEGIAMLADEIVTDEKARFFIGNAYEIIEFIKNGIPEELRWPEFTHEINIKFGINLPQSDAESS